MIVDFRLPEGWRFRLALFGPAGLRLTMASFSRGGRVLRLHLWWLFAAFGLYMAALLVLRVAAGVTLPEPLAGAGFAAVALACGVVAFKAVSHEMGHVWGIPATGCPAGHLWCCMAEESMLGLPDGSVLGKARLVRHQLPWGAPFCPACRAMIYETRLLEAAGELGG